MAFLSEMEPKTGFLAEITDQGKELATAYREAKPFPHVVIDDFLPPPVLKMCLEEFGRRQKNMREFNAATERKKRQYNPDQMSPGPRTLFYAFNSLPFVRLLENITGIKGLVPDPYFHGAGFHEIQQGGHLSVHADFNLHDELRLERRINVLIYLNEDWQDEYGGQLELWDEAMAACQQSIVPVFNRCVIFTTTSTSYHGNPNPIAHPKGVTRKSIALYYYTSTWSDQKQSHSTLFQNSAEEIPPSGVRHLVKQITPPIVWEAARKVAGKP